MTDDVAPADRARARIRSAFAVSRAAPHGPLHVAPLADDAPLSVLLRAAQEHANWKQRVAEVAGAMDDHLAAAGRMIAGLERDVELLGAVADHLQNGAKLPAAADGSVLLAARLLAGTEAGLAAGRQMRQELGPAQRQLDAVRAELVRAKSAAAVAQASATLAYIDALGLGSSPDATRVRAAWQAAVASHRALLAEQRGRTRDAIEEAAA